jgi:hypothetical protein
MDQLLDYVAYDSANASSGNFKHWVIGTAGTNATMLHFGYSPIKPTLTMVLVEVGVVVIMFYYVDFQ